VHWLDSNFNRAHSHTYFVDILFLLFFCFLFCPSLSRLCFTEHTYMKRYPTGAHVGNYEKMNVQKRTRTNQKRVKSHSLTMMMMTACYREKERKRRDRVIYTSRLPIFRTFRMYSCKRMCSRTIIIIDKRVSSSINEELRIKHIIYIHFPGKNFTEVRMIKMF
jgi:hypothetical protein